MNGLEEYKKDRAAKEFPQGQTIKEVIRNRGWGNYRECFIGGFDAVVALDLPIKFHDWFMTMNKMGSEIRKKMLSNDEIRALDHYPNTYDIYQYWINHVYKFE